MGHIIGFGGKYYTLWTTWVEQGVRRYNYIKNISKTLSKVQKAYQGVEIDMELKRGARGAQIEAADCTITFNDNPWKNQYGDDDTIRTFGTLQGDSQSLLIDIPQPFLKYVSGRYPYYLVKVDGTFRRIKNRSYTVRLKHVKDKLITFELVSITSV